MSVINGENKKFRYKNIVIRILIGGSVISLATILSKLFGPFWGGFFAAFPASYITNINLIYSSSGGKMLNKIFKTIPAGTILLVVYSITFKLFILETNIGITTLFSYLITSIVFYIIYKVIIVKSK